MGFTPTPRFRIELKNMKPEDRCSHGLRGGSRRLPEIPPGNTETGAVPRPSVTPLNRKSESDRQEYRLET